MNSSDFLCRIRRWNLSLVRLGRTTWQKSSRYILDTDAQKDVTPDLLMAVAFNDVPSVTKHRAWSMSKGKDFENKTAVLAELKTYRSHRFRRLKFRITKRKFSILVVGCFFQLAWRWFVGCDAVFSRFLIIFVTFFHWFIKSFFMRKKKKGITFTKCGTLEFIDNLNRIDR